MTEPIKIRVESGIVPIEVNDNGDTIQLKLGDERFIKDFFDMTNKIADRADTLSKIETEDVREMIEADINFHEGIKDDFIKVFGLDTYETVFGKDVLIGSEYILEFIEQLLPIVMQFTDSRMKKLSKYSADRIGSSL